MVTMAPATLVAPPTRTALPYGLFSHLTPRPEGDGRWQSGVEFESAPCPSPLGVIGAWDCDDPDATPGLPKDLDATENGLGVGSPITAYGHFTCNPVGWSAEAAQTRANDDLLRGEEAAVERALWTGEQGNVPNLAGVNGMDAPVTLDGGDIVAVVAQAEDFLAEYHQSLGMIHMRRSMALLAITEKAVEVRNGRLYTRIGTPVVAGAGYPGTGPDGDIGGSDTWVYVTGPMFVYRSEVFTSSNRAGDLMNRGRNDLMAVAERTYVLGLDPCPVGAGEVTL